MKRRKKALLTSILALPLLMSNSVMVEPSYDFDYQSVVVSCIHDGTYEETDNYTKEKYLVTIENQGNRYPEISSDRLRLNDKYLWSYDWKDKLFTNEVVPSGETKTYSLITRDELPLKEDGDDDWRFLTMNLEDQNVSFSNYSISQFDGKVYEIQATVEGLGDYEYAAIVDVTYKGVRYAFRAEMYSSGGLYRISAKEELDLSQLTIDSIKAYRSYENSPNIFRDIGEGLLKGFWGMLTSPTTWLFLLLALLPPVIIVGTVVLIVCLAGRKNKGKKK